MLTSKNKVIVYAQDAFNGDTAKTGIGFIRYGLCETVGIVDKFLSGKTAKDIVSDLPPVPIFSSIEDSRNARKDADVLLIGIAPPGGKLPVEWLPDIKKAITLKLNIINGLHEFLTKDDEINLLSKKNNVFVWDVRKTDNNYPIANARLLNYPFQIILTVGTDASIGKMTVALELDKTAREKGLNSKFIATGQTGMMISGDGVPIDAIVGDFMAGAIEQEIIKQAGNDCKIAFVEGQGSILHPGWSGVTLALFHGSLPHKLILCHKVGREYLRNTKVRIKSLNDFIKVYENISLPLRLAKVVGVGLNTSGLDEVQVKNAISIIEQETGLPVDDVIRNGGDKLLKACL